MSCSICTGIEVRTVARTGRDESLPPTTRWMKPLGLRHPSVWLSDEDLWHCPECGAFYLWENESSFTGSGINDTQTLTRLAQRTLPRLQGSCEGRKSPRTPSSSCSRACSRWL